MRHTLHRPRHNKVKVLPRCVVLLCGLGIDCVEKVQIAEVEEHRQKGANSANLLLGEPHLTHLLPKETKLLRRTRVTERSLKRSPSRWGQINYDSYTYGSYTL